MWIILQEIQAIIRCKEYCCTSIPHLISVGCQGENKKYTVFIDSVWKVMDDVHNILLVRIYLSFPEDDDGKR